MIKLITAVPGSGKSMYLVKLVLDYIEADKKALKDWKPSADHPSPPKPRQIYANINGLDKQTIFKKYGGLWILDTPDDWRDTPDGSIVIYDEAQERFPSTGKPGRPDDPILQALEKHRHTGHDLIFSTQEPTFVHHHIRKLVGEHKALHRGAVRGGCIVYTWVGKCGDPDDFHSVKKANAENFNFKKKYWSLYKSTTIDTHKFKLPSKLVWIAVAIVAILAWPIYRMTTGQFLDFDGTDVAAESIGLSETPTAQNAEGVGGGAASGAYPWVNAETVSPINGCASGRHCRCWGFDGQVIAMEESACRNLAEGYTPMPLDLNLFREAPTGLQPASGGVGAQPQR